MKKLFLLFAIAGFTRFTPVMAQTANTDTATMNFIVHASIGGLNEISAGQLAAQKATDPEIKSFGTRMVADHSKAQEKLVQLAKTKGYQIPPEATNMPMPDPMLKKAAGKDFDKLYVHMMVPGHRQTVLLFQTYAISGKDADVKAFVLETLPVLKEHLAAISAIDAKIMDTTK